MSEVLHSKIGASSMHRWAVCPGSVRLSEGIPNVSSKYAEEGTEAHELAAEILTTGVVVGPDPEMLENVMVYVQAVREEAKGCHLMVEHRFDLSKIHEGCFGTCDAVIFNAGRKLLSVWDLKYGAGIPVEVEDNEQLKFYGLGALLSTDFAPDEIELVIAQPRCAHPKGPIRKHRFPAIELLDFAADLKAAALRTEDPNAPLVPGDHCRFCPAAAICPKLKNKAQEIAKSEFTEINTDVKTFTPAQLAETLTWLPILEAWTENVRSYAYNEAMAGRTIPGFKLVEKRATRKWADEKEAEAFMHKEFQSSVTRTLFDPPALKSVAQVEKVLDKKQHEKLSHLISKVSSGNTLVPLSDKRPAIQILEAKAEFEVLDLFS